MVCQFIFLTRFDKFYPSKSGGCMTPCALYQQARNWQGRMKARRVGMRSCQRSGWGWEGNTAMRFPGLVLPRKMNKTKNSHKSPENSGLQTTEPVRPKLHKTHTATVWKIRGTGTLRYGIA